MTYGADVSPGMAAVFNAKAESIEALRGKMAATVVNVTDAAEVAAAQAEGKLPATGTVEVRQLHAGCVYATGVVDVVDVGLPTYHRGCPAASCSVHTAAAGQMRVP